MLALGVRITNCDFYEKFVSVSKSDGNRANINWKAVFHIAGANDWQRRPTFMCEKVNNILHSFLQTTLRLINYLKTSKKNNSTQASNIFFFFSSFHPCKLQQQKGYV